VSLSLSGTVIIDLSTDIQAIRQSLQEFAATINSMGVNIAAADLESFFYGSSESPAPFTMNKGIGRSQYIDGWVSDVRNNIAPRGPASIGDVSVNYELTRFYEDYFSARSLSGLPTKVYLVSFSVAQSGNSALSRLLMARNGAGQWSIIGDTTKVEIEFHPMAVRQITSTTDTLWTGLIGRANNKDLSTTIQSMRIYGPGLPGYVSEATPGTGVYFKKESSSNRIQLDPQFQTSNLEETMYVMNDQAISQIQPMSKYTVKLYTDASGTVLDSTFPWFLFSAPVKNADITNAYFPALALTGLTHSVTPLVPSKTLSFTYSKSALYSASWLDLGMPVWGNGGSDYAETDLSAGSSSGQIVSPACSGFTATGGLLHLTASDGNDREFWWIWVFDK
jgi:hypothetical protein